MAQALEIEDEPAIRVEKPHSLALFGEMGLVSVVVLLTCLIPGGWVAALAGGVAHIRRHLSGRSDTVADQFVLTTQALKGGWGLGLASTAVGLGLWANARLLTTGAVPGGVTLHGVTVALAAAGWIILVRTAALWSTLDGSTSPFSSRAWWRLLSEGARVSRHDLSGTLLLASALVLGVSLVWMFTPVGIVVPGLWAIAAVGVEFRRLGRTQATP